MLTKWRDIIFHLWNESSYTFFTHEHWRLIIFLCLPKHKFLSSVLLHKCKRDREDLQKLQQTLDMIIYLGHYAVKGKVHFLRLFAMKDSIIAKWRRMGLFMCKLLWLIFCKMNFLRCFSYSYRHLKVHQCRFENLPISASSYKNMLAISH